MTKASLPAISKQEFLDAIRDGVNDAMWRMITNSTSAPCHDFYDTVKEGVAEAMKELRHCDAFDSGEEVK